jgi:4-hydroxybutyryl-CoA dehydratase / vinylacetyl-CoA-Delta-isomerase
MLTGEQYRASIRGYRASYLEGERIQDPTEHPLIKSSVDWVAETYDRFYSSEPGAINPMFGLPHTREELQRQMERLLVSDLTASQTAGCMALATIAPRIGATNDDFRRRLEQFLASCLAADVRIAVAQQDAGGVRVVERNDKGIVIKGSKQHVVGAAIVHELFVVPARQMKAGEEEQAVACAVAVDSPGVRIVSMTPAPRAPDTRDYPISRKRAMPTGVVLFDNVFVPNERVFLDGAPALSGLIGDALGVWERARSVADQADMAELMLGLAQTIAEMNGVPNIEHILDKLSNMAVYAAMCRAGWETALARASVGEGGMIQPDEAFIYAAKAYGAQAYGEMVGYLQDVAGGSIATVPSNADIDNPEIGAYVVKYMRTKAGVSGADRVKVFHIIRDLTADVYGGWVKVSNQHIAGGIFAARQAAHRKYDLEAVRERVREVLATP